MWTAQTKQHDLVEAAEAADLSSVPADELACRAQNGCAVAFAELFDRYRPRLIRFLEPRLSGTSIDAEDVSQETLAKAWRALKSFDTRRKFTTWLYTIARRTATDHLRRSRPTRDASDLLSVVAEHPTAIDTVVEAEDRKNIWEVARRILPQTQYSAIWLRYGEELTVKEVASILGKTTVGIRVLLHRGRARLRNHLQDYAPSHLAQKAQPREDLKCGETQGEIP